MTPEASRRLDLIRFPMILAVVYIHAHVHSHVVKSIPGAVEPFAPQVFLQNLISEVLARVAVPLFFALSGYLFFLGFDGSAASFGRKFRSRFWSLVVPYVFWNLAIRAVFVASGGRESTQLLDGGYVHFLASSLGSEKFPAVYPLWFIRDLILLVAASPLVYALIRLAGGPVVAALAACWATEAWPTDIPSIEGVFFFTLGGYGGLQKIDPFAVDRFGPWVLAAYAPLAIVDAFLVGTPSDRLVHPAAILVGLFAALYATKAAIWNDRLGRALAWLAPSTFFVFAAHEPLLGVTIKAMSRRAGGGDGLRGMAIYLLAPILVCGILVPLHPLLVRVAPRFTRIVTGGRG
ncbi:acyltransferase family protein [Paludisphaera soli]|uniref:acyltransferase family protein n=1 Tax=Paludisphaera soli TaxID=2712865 RepID=UPI0013ED4117|nr:acyltransferase [Paludisphaera soli]